MPDVIDSDLVAEEFPLRDDVIYLNHAAVAPWPRRAAEAVKAFAEENLTQGSREYPRWLATEARLREQLRWLLNAPSSRDIALVKNTSEALSFVAYGLKWQPGDNIVISNEEFPSNRIVWESLADRGVTVREVDLHAAATPEEALIAAMDEHTRLLAISSVQYASGLRVDLERLGGHCSEAGVLFCVDAIQSLGAVAMDVQAIRADFVMADGHKWLLGPEGLGVFYCREPLREQLRLTQFGWHMVENAGDFDQRQWWPAADARRFECGSPNMLAIHALSASLSLFEQLGMGAVERSVTENTRFVFELCQNDPSLELLTDTLPGRYAGIACFRHRSVDNETLFRRLQEAGVMCALRGGGIRFSPHFYTDKARIEAAFSVTKTG